MLEHGGNLQAAATRFGQSHEAWLDLSTGINPCPYPVPALATDVWHRLPEQHPGLVKAAAQYYGAPNMLPVAGTQAAIQALPCLRPASRVVVAAPAYAEHAHCWTRSGHAVREVAYAELATAVEDCDVMVICNPNNPTGATVAPALLLDWAGQLAARGGWLVVDEAFADTTPALSVAAWSAQAGLIVLRSVGKFFGLAGLRLGFVAAEETLLRQLADYLGPWSVSGPAQAIGFSALSDTQWQRDTRVRLLRDGERLHSLLSSVSINSNGSALYQWWAEADAECLQQHMAERALWVRLFTRGAGGIRLGLPAEESGWQRLQTALSEWRVRHITKRHDQNAE
ncbi:threonine-phosphate decarboxylase CobD [Glaciimonas immobilis]|uniref:threonine-phosphate decarboxylase n=1 Tax=Glaciimonas immobilis TaxID=728004 RepID=A0A840RSH7_9BURK|nr:threonine-phosphate decarboxylase CobD [Glaciimonas immobilis]KAF3997063.1 threonine-phosphate decarboxylase [Glaciimonas immobilis]MBB5199916.1 cobalamin biosynthetic protein CobC [Glaciimonas immobilis]